MELMSGTLAAITLTVLWSAEALAPGLIGPAAGLAQRLRHLALGLLNAGAAGLTAWLFLALDTPAARADFGLLRLADLPLWVAVPAGLALLDLWQYACHVAFHHVPILWRFHAVHHNADRLDATVAMRFHMAEILVHGLLTIPFALALGIGIETVALYNLILLPASLFHHANVRIGPSLDRWLRLVIVTPRMHWLHHSRWQPETNSNYASVLSVWDRLFGTLRSRRRAETVDVGLDGYDPDQIDSLRGMIASPFGPARSEFGRAPAPELLEPDAPLFRPRARGAGDPGLRRARPSQA